MAGHFINTIKMLSQNFQAFFDGFKFRSNKANKLFSIAVFLIAINIFYTYVGVYKFINKRPSSIHMSAQCSRASVALNYYENNMNFFTPQYQRNMEGPGYTGLEFPAIYYMGAVCYKIFGFNEIYLRLISLIIFSFGMLLFYMLTLKYTKSNWVSLSIVAAVICSPVLIFYTPNFMPDPPSLALIMGAWYFLFKYIQTNKNTHLNLFAILATFGVLLKVTAAICFVIVIVLLILDALKFFKNTERVYLFTDKKKVIFRIIISLIIIGSWYKYSRWFPEAYGGQSFLLSPNAYQNWEGLVEVLGWMEKLWLNHYYSYESYVLLGAVTIFIILAIKFVNRLLLTITILYILGSLCYFLFFLNQFMHHDYYVITMFPSFFFLFLCFADIVTKISNKYFFLTKSILLIVLFFNLKESVVKCKKNIYERNGTDIFYWTGDFRAYEDLEPKLRKLGLTRTDRVVSGYDPTDCGSLYLMNQLGVTFGDGAEKEQVNSFISHKNAKYLILTDSAKFKKDYGYDFSKNVISTHRGLIIYKIK
jgi:hypothetical protein